MYFSIVTTCFNSSNTIRNTLDSILHQTFCDYEYIVYDAGSTDGTVDILNEYVHYFNGRMKYTSEPDNGIYDGMNKGVNDAQGHYVSILNSDDYYHGDTLKRVYEASKKYEIEELPIIFGDVCRIKRNGEPVYRYHFDYSRIERNIPFGHPSMFVPKRVYEEEGLYDYKKYKLAADMDFQYRLYRKKDNYKWIVLDQLFTYMREGGATDNLENIKKWTKEMTDLEVEYNDKKRMSAVIESFVGRIGRSLKNRLPYSVQKKMYNIYRVNKNEYTHR